MENNFSYQTKTFTLTGSLQDDKLSLKLEDYVQWAFYQKQYTNQDSGQGEIHKKMGIEDIYSSIVQIRCKSDEKSMEQKQTGMTKLQNYQYGTILKFKDLPCYKLEKGGKITVYLTLQDKMTKKQTIYESKLSLNIIKKLTEKQIQEYLQNQKKKETQQKFIQQLIQQRKQNIILQQKLHNTTNQLCSLKEQFIEFKKLTGYQITQNKNKISEVEKTFEEKLSQLNKYLILRISQIQQQNSKNFAITLKDAQFHYYKSIYLEKFICSKNTIEYVGQKSTWTQNIVQKPIPYETPYTFSVKMVNYPSKYYFMIGIVDFQKQKNARTSYSSGNAVIYYRSIDNKGHKYPYGNVEGAGFGQGDIVDVIVNLANKKIMWKVNGSQQASYTLDFLQQKNRTFMPYFEAYQPNTIVQILKL